MKKETLLPQGKQAPLHDILSNAANLGEWKVLNLPYKERQVNLSKVNGIVLQKGTTYVWV